MPPKLRILFLCTGNSCRSQMAEGWARRLHAERIEPHSAGTLPARLDPRAVKVMAEAGVDISGQRSKHVDDVSGIAFECVVTVCDRANKDCPVFPGEIRRLHMGFDDPPRLATGASSEEQALEHYRRVRDEIRGYVSRLPDLIADGPRIEPGNETD